MDHYLVAQTITDRNMQLILRASRVEVGYSHHCAQSIEQYFSPGVLQYFSQSIPQYFSDATALHWWVCASIYERLAQAIPAKYSPYSNDTLTDRRREGRNYWWAYESKIRTVCSILGAATFPRTSQRRSGTYREAGKQCRVKAIRKIFEYSQPVSTVN